MKYLKFTIQFRKKEKVSDNKEDEEKLKKMRGELNNTIKTREEEIKKVEKADMELLN